MSDQILAKLEQEVTAVQHRAAAEQAQRAAQGRAVIDAYASEHPAEIAALRAADSAVREARQRLTDAEQRLQHYNSAPPVDAAGVAAWAQQRAALAGAIEGYSLLVDRAVAEHARLSDTYRAALGAHIRAELATSRAALETKRAEAVTELNRLMRLPGEHQARAQAEIAAQISATIAPLEAAAALLGVDTLPVVRLAA